MDFGTLDGLLLGAPHLHGAMVGTTADEASELGWVGAGLVGMPLGATVGACLEGRGFGAVFCLMCFKCIALEAHQDVHVFVGLYLSGRDECIVQSQSVQSGLVCVFGRLEFCLEDVGLVRPVVVVAGRKFCHFNNVELVFVSQFCLDFVLCMLAGKVHDLTAN